MKKSKPLPKSIARGAARVERRKFGGPAPAPTTGSVIRALVPVRPVLPPPSSVPSAVKAARTPPAFAAGRLTAVRAIEAQRDKGRARAVEAGPVEAARSFGRQVRSNVNAKKAAGVHMTRQNPASPFTDLVTGRRRYSGAFSSGVFTAPFQKSWNNRRQFGA